MFCHSEGLNAKENFKTSKSEQFVALLREAVYFGYNDITFTGGEPLLKKKLLITIIKELSLLKIPPEITIVTNAVCLTDDILNAFAVYPGNLKLNISFHSHCRNQFDEVTQSQNCFDVVSKNIKKAVIAGIKVKLNCVVMAGINNSQKNILKYLQKAKKFGVAGVKFLELLVLPQNEEQFKYFISSKAIVNQLKEMKSILIKENDRVQFLTNEKFPNLNIEVTRLTCKVGCAKCMLIRDKTLGPNLNYYPCFIQSEKPIVISAPQKLSKAFIKGKKIIAKYAKQYGTDSPILIKQDKYVKNRSNAFFSIGISNKKVAKIIEKYGFSIAKKLAFNLYYVQPKEPDKEWINGRKCLEFGFDKHSPNIIEFIFSQFQKVLHGNIVCWRQEFINNISPPTCKSIEEAQEIMDALSFKCYMNVHFNITEYKKDNLIISVDNTSNFQTIKIEKNLLNSQDVGNLLEEIEAINIKKPYHLWLKNKQQKRTFT